VAAEDTLHSLVCDGCMRRLVDWVGRFPWVSSLNKRKAPPRQQKAGWATLSWKFIAINKLTGWATRRTI